MSRSVIRCERCRAPIAEKHRSGYIEVVVAAISAQRLHKHGSTVTCKACGEELYIRQNHPLEEAA